MKKANSIFTISRDWRGSNATFNTTIDINDVNNIAEYDSGSDFTSSIDISVKNCGTKSPWKDELKFDYKTCSSASTDEDVEYNRDALEIIPEKKSPKKVAHKVGINKSFGARVTPAQQKLQIRRSTVSGIKKNSKYNWAGTFNNKAKKRITFNQNSLAEIADDGCKNNSTADERISSFTLDPTSELSVFNLLGNDSLKVSDKRQYKFSNIDGKSDYKLNNLTESDTIFPAMSDNSYFIKKDASPAKVNIFDHESEKNRVQSLLKSTANLDSSILKVNGGPGCKLDTFQSNFNTSTPTKRWMEPEIEYTSTILEKSNLEKTTNSNIADVSIINAQSKDKESSGKPICRRVFKFLLNFIKNLILFTVVPAAYIAFFVYFQNVNE